MHVVLISGSHRPAGETHRIAAWFAAQLAAQGHTSHTINVATAGLPMWDEGLWGKGESVATWQRVWQPHSQQLLKADALIVLAPEYAGMAPAALKNALLLMNADEVGHKPALLVATTSSGTNGAYPISELRSSGYKNNKIMYLPEHLIIRHVGEVLKADVKPEFASADAYLTERAQWCLTLLAHYATALAAVRATGHHAHAKFPFGM
jgi:NAD(P)H-dependent FMN reductase